MNPARTLSDQTPSERTYSTLIRVDRAVQLLGMMGSTPHFMSRSRANERVRRAVARIHRREAEFQAAMLDCPRPFSKG